MTAWFYTNITDKKFTPLRDHNDAGDDNTVPGLYSPSFDVLVDYHLSESRSLPWPPSRGAVAAGDAVFIYRRHYRKNREHSHDGALVAWGNILSDAHHIVVPINRSGDHARRNVVRASLVMLPPERAISWSTLTSESSPLKTIASLTKGNFAPPITLNEEQREWLVANTITTTRKDRA